MKKYGTITSALLTAIILISPMGCQMPGEDGKDGSNHLISVVEISAGEDCENGGLRIATGYDENGNGSLDVWEELTLEFLCNNQPTSITCDCEDGKDGTTTLFDSLQEDPGENCEYGGIALRWGLDDDDSGDLTENEIDHTDYICNGNPGIPTLVVVSQEDSGQHCTNGGVVIMTGVDTNEDGYLQSGEIDSTEYICNGQDGATSLIVQQQEPAGANCTDGGTVINSGIDVDGNLVLDATEVTSISYICN